MRTFHRRMKTMKWIDRQERDSFSKMTFKQQLRITIFLNKPRGKTLKLESISVNKQFAEGFEQQSTFQITSGDRKLFPFSEIHMKFL